VRPPAPRKAPISARSSRRAQPLAGALEHPLLERPAQIADVAPEPLGDVRELQLVRALDVAVELGAQALVLAAEGAHDRQRGDARDEELRRHAQPDRPRPVERSVQVDEPGAVLHSS